MKTSAFTFIEVLLVIGILLIFTISAVPAFRFFEKRGELNNSLEEIINGLRITQAKTLGSEGASQWGVHFSISTDPHQYTLFKGNSYSTRDTSFDQTYKLAESVEIYELNLTGPGSEIVFNRVNGTTDNEGDISLRMKNNPADSKTIYIEQSGRIGLTAASTPPDTNREKDSRHIHFDYSRTIATTTENLILTFEGGINETIVITDNMKDGQIFWQQEVEVAGDKQQLKIHTHRLNDAVSGSQFCVHRDRRFNNKALSITISGDGSGTLLEYSADGLTTFKTSIYATEPVWQ